GISEAVSALLFSRYNQAGRLRLPATGRARTGALLPERRTRRRRDHRQRIGDSESQPAAGQAPAFRRSTAERRMGEVCGTETAGQRAYCRSSFVLEAAWPEAGAHAGFPAFQPVRKRRAVLRGTPCTAPALARETSAPDIDRLPPGKPGKRSGSAGQGARPVCEPVPGYFGAGL